MATRRTSEMTLRVILLVLGFGCGTVLLTGQAFDRLPPELASTRLRQVATICGMALDLGCDGPDPGAVLTIRTPVTAPPFSITMTQADRGRFGLRPSDRVVPQHLCVNGTVEAAPGGGYRIVVTRTDQLQIERTAESTPGAELAYRPCEQRVVPPKILRETPAQYTPEAMRAGIQGAVWLQGVVGANGLVTSVEVIRSLDPGGLDEIAVKALSAWRFRPGRRSGKVVPVIVTVQMAFSMKNGPVARWP